MKTLTIVLSVAVFLVLIFGVTSSGSAFAAPLALVGASVVPVHMQGNHPMTGPGMGYHHGYRGWRGYGWWNTYPGNSGTYQDGDKTCVWNGYNYQCYQSPDTPDL